MTRALVSAMIVCATLSVSSAKTVSVYIGTYSQSPSKGIYRCTLDQETGALSEPVLAAEASNPSFLEIHPNGKFLYAVNEAGRNGEVAAYAIDPDSGNLTELNRQPSGGASPCHVNIDPTGPNLLVVNYSSGNASVIPIQSDGRLAEPTDFVQHTGSGPNQNRQKGPHAHSVNLSPDGRFAFIADLGIDKIMIYRLDSSKGTLTPNDPAFAALKPGAGPRHLSFHPNGRYVYVINELDCTITVFNYQPESGTLTPIQSISTLPDDFNGSNSCAEVRVHPNGQFVYGSNRGHNSIAAYQVDPTDGKLTFIAHQSTDIKTPRNFNIDPTGRFCLVANQDGNSIVVFRINLQTGVLEPTSHKITVGKPVCIRFLDLNRNTSR